MNENRYNIVGLEAEACDLRYPPGPWKRVTVTAESVNADLLAACEACVTDDPAYGTDTPKLRARLSEINAICRATIARATGEVGA